MIATRADIWRPGRGWCAKLASMTAGSTHRSNDRSAMVAFRLSFEDRAALRSRAAAEGVSVQTYLERVVMGRVNATDRPSGRPFESTRRSNSQEGLPMTG